MSCDSPDQSERGIIARSHIDVYASYLLQLLGNSEGVRGEEVRGDEEMVLVSLEMVLSCGPPLDQLVAEGEGVPLPL